MNSKVSLLARTAAYLPIAVTCIVVFYFSNTVLWIGDDMKFMFIFGPYGATDAPVDTCSDLLQSQYWHWFSENGRLTAHFFVRVFNCFLGQTAFAVVNALFWAAIIIVSLRLAGIRHMNAGKIMTATILMLLVFSTRMVPSCQIGYVWMFFITSIWILVFMSRRDCREIVPCCLLLIFSIIAGNSHEALNIPIGAATLIYLIRERKNLKTKQIVMASGFFAGILILSLSPATLNRAEHNSISLFGSLYYLLIFSHTAYIAVITVLLARYKWGKTWKQIYSENSFYCDAAGVALLFNMVLGVIVPRQLFGQEFLFAIIVMRLLPHGSFKKAVNATLAVVISVVWIYNFTESKKINNMFEQITRSALTGENEIYVDTWNVSDDNLFNYCKEINGSIHYKDEFNLRTLKRYFRTVNPSADFNILPVWLKEKDDIALNDTVIEYHDGAFLVISKGDRPRHVYGQRTLFGPLRVPFGRVDISVYEPVKETPLWRAWVVEDIMTGTRFRSFEFGQPDSAAGNSTSL